MVANRSCKMVDEKQSLTIIAPFTPDFSCALITRLRLLACPDKAIAPGRASDVPGSDVFLSCLMDLGPGRAGA